MIARIFVTDPAQRITVEEIRKHPWYSTHRPETLSFYVCPPHMQHNLKPFITRGTKKYTVN